VAKVKKRIEEGQSLRFLIEAPAHLAKYIATKGSICMDGVSLTVNMVRGASFEVNIVPHTLRETTLGSLVADGLVNVEVDMMARYAERLLMGDQAARSEGLSREVLARAGFIDD